MENLRKRVRESTNLLKNSNQKFEDIFNVMFLLKDKTFLEYSENFKIKKLSYGDAEILIHNVAYSISNKLNVKDEYIALSMDNSKEWLITFWAILMSGNKPYLVNLRHPKSLTNKILKDLKAKYVISLNEDSYEDAKTILFNELNEKCPSNYEFNFGNEIALSTSATTLKAKIIFYKGENISTQILNAPEVIRRNKIVKKHYKGELKLLAFLPFYHIFGLQATYFWFAFFGRTLVLMNDYSSESIIRTIQKHKVTHVFGVPLLWHTIESTITRKVHQMGEKKEKKFYKGIEISTKLQNVFPHLGKIIARRMFKEVNEKLFNDSVYVCISGGSYLKDSSLKLINALGYPLFNGYGMTEIGITSVELRNKVKYRNLNTIGKPLPSVEYVIKDDVLYVKGTSTCYKMMINGETILNDELFKTDDIVSKDKKGYYYVLGRKNDVVISDSGENINPDLIEKEFDFDGRLRYSVLGIKNKDNNDELTLVIELNKNLTQIEIQRTIEKAYEVNDKLIPTYKIKNFYFTYDLISSKEAIKVSRSFVLNGLTNDTIHLIPFSEIKEKKLNNEVSENEELVNIIREIFAEILNKDVNEIDINAHFIHDLGGSSLDYFGLVSKINERFDITISFTSEEYVGSVNEFALLVERRL